VILLMDDVHAYYGYSHVLQGISLRLDEGEIVCLLGRNGVGKTTTVRTIMGLVPVRRGTVQFCDQSLVNQPTHAIARRGVAYVPEDRRILAGLTVAENLTLAAQPKPGGRWTIERIYDLFPRLCERRRQAGETLSGGEQQMLAIGRALMGNPRLLLLDEPSQGLAPQLVRAVAEVVREIRNRGLTILLVEQNVHLALDLGDRHYILSKGRIVHEATSAKLRADHSLTQRYLGV